MANFRLPGNSHHHAILGSNGSGKTRFAVWALAHRDYNSRPWIIIDFKEDDLIARLPATEIDVTDKLPKASQPGLYVIRPHPSQQDELADLFVRIWQQKNMGVYVDEGYMIDSTEANDAYKYVLTQGRSKLIPTVTLSQRPVWINRFVLSEATFYTVFRLNDRRDRMKVHEFMPKEAQVELPPFHSWYYDSGKHALNVVKPVPDDDSIVSLFMVEKPKRKWFV
jgi:hypothetical protein